MPAIRLQTDWPGLNTVWNQDDPCEGTCTGPWVVLLDTDLRRCSPRHNDLYLGAELTRLTLSVLA
jgi:hypothetical protein